MAIKIPTNKFIQELSERKVPIPMEFIASGMENEHLPSANCPEFALVGRSNVGKSSLLNLVAGQNNLARVSRTPGRTQTINYFTSGDFAFLDLPGYGFAKSPHETRAHWEKNLSKFFKEREGLFVVFMLMDCRREVEEEDKLLAEWFHTLELNVVCILTKIDKLNRSDLKKAERKFSEALDTELIVSTSSEKRLGLDSLFQMMASLLKLTQPKKS